MIPLSDPDVRRGGYPYVSIGLIALNALVFLYELTLGDAATTQFFYKWGLIPAELAQGQDYSVLLTGTGPLDIESTLPAWGTVFSAMFIHGGFMHFAGNMLFLWVFGDNVEDRLGHVKYLLFYLACGVAATWAQVAIDMGSQVPNIGASGAIAGVLGAYLLLFPYSRINTLVIFYFITVVRVPALFLLGFWFLLQFFSGVGSIGAAAHTTGVAYWAHIGGFVAGILAVALYLKALGQPVLPSHRRTPWHWDR
ncbi:MAG: rhomboid family intramembrane serine protease [Chloroflexi bacterium]|nr:rhomboid family intramembrane serine protease [Chloroflexota bacterium]